LIFCGVFVAMELPTVATTNSSSSSSSTTVTIEGINVEFPKNPYPCQVDYMRSAIVALNTGTNALLESPTGTGKTLCLLCSTLAWQEHFKKSNTKKKINIGITNGPTVAAKAPTASTAVPAIAAAYAVPPVTIIYASRTHSQLAQVVSELRTTSYRPNMTVLGSREQLCVHERIKTKRGAALNFACNKEVSARSCIYKNNVERYTGPDPSHFGGNCSSSRGSKPSSIIMDIEDLVSLGTTDRVCPYYFTRGFAERADLVLMPYNYLLDSSIRATINLPWAKSIVIFDEAHNVERVAADAASFKLTSTDIANCITELQNTLRQLNQLGPQASESSSTSKNPSDKKSGLDMSPPTVQAVARLLRALFELEKKLDEIPLSKGIFNALSMELTGESIIRMMETCGLSFALVRDTEHY
jgi:regulator of telomere elongation helicase 1